jgi:hypothetical protein
MQPPKNSSYHHYHKNSQPISVSCDYAQDDQIDNICFGTIMSKMYESLKLAGNAMDQVDAPFVSGGRILQDIFNKVPSQTSHWRNLFSISCNTCIRPQRRM